MSGADARSNAERTAAIEARLGHTFADRELLRRALTHRSATQESPGAASYERLEFLGDAVLGALAAEWLYQQLAADDEGELSKVKSYLVSEPALAAFAEQLELGPLLRLGVGEERSGGRAKPSLLADALEALIGALYLDGGLAATRTFVTPLLGAGLDAWRGGAAQRDAKTALQERLQAVGSGPPDYRLVATSGPDHQKSFVVECWSEGRLLATGEGSSKKRAEQAAATAALASFDA
ncbi:MAG TPA: ribonuclease III [Thermoanaerobaculia bacterium]|jgi:ribonuclease-3|nr:ribonuclease III [Thermoanaerobaculia bacterium]